MSTPASLYILRNALYLSIETESRQSLRAPAAFFWASCCSASCRGWRARPGFGRTAHQLDAAESEFHHVTQYGFGVIAVGHFTKTVGNGSYLHAAKFRIGLRSHQARRKRQSSGGHFSDISSRVKHRFPFSVLKSNRE